MKKLLLGLLLLLVGFVSNAQDMAIMTKKADIIIQNDAVTVYWVKGNTGTSSFNIVSSYKTGVATYRLNSSSPNTYMIINWRKGRIELVYRGVLTKLKIKRTKRL